MELAQENLNEYLIRKDYQIDEYEFFKIVDQITDGLYLCHIRNIVNFNLKLENILMFPNGDVKIGDFGLIKIVEFGTLIR